MRLYSHLSLGKPPATESWLTIYEQSTGAAPFVARPGATEPEGKRRVMVLIDVLQGIENRSLQRDIVGLIRWLLVLVGSN
jgi:hypothetical protein